METETKTETETKSNTKKLGFSNTNPVVLECPVCSKPFERETKQKAFNAIRGHYLGTKDGKHEGSFPYTLSYFGSTPPKPPQREAPSRRAKSPIEHKEPVSPVKPMVEEVFEEEPEELIERPLEEPLPTELDYLNTLLLEHGVRKRAVVLRALDLREPTNFYELVDALTDVGVNKARQRRILKDYGAWLGKAIPQDIEDELSPDDEADYTQTRSSRWGRRGDSRRGQDGMSDLEGIAEVFREVGNIYERARPRETIAPPNDTYQKLYEDEKAKNEKLRDELTDAKIETLRQEFNAKLSTQDDGVKMAITKLEQPIRRMGDIVEKMVAGAFETEFPRKPPARKKLGEPTILESIPDEMIE